MKIGQILLPFIAVSILLILVTLGLFVYYTDSNTNNKEQNPSKFDTSEAKRNIALINNGLELADITINIVVPEIHKNIVNNLKNKIHKSKNYDNELYNYQYNFMLCAYSMDSGFEMEYSTFDNDLVNYEIKSTFDKIVLENNDNKLKFSNIVNKIVVIDNKSYIFSVKYVFNNNGELLGGVALLLRMKLFIDIGNFVNNADANFYMEVLDNSDNIIYGKIKNGNYNNRVSVYNENYDITISYISKLEQLDKKDITLIYTPIFYILMLLFGFILVYYKWVINKLNKKFNLPEESKIDIVETKNVNNIEHLLNTYNNFICKIGKYKISNNILKIKDNILELKRITHNIDNNLTNLQEMVSMYKNLEMNGNILEINIAILCNQLNDNRLNDMLVMIRGLNQKLRDSNSNIENNLSAQSEYNKLFTIFDKVNNLLELLDSTEKNRVNTINSFKEKLEKNSNEIK